MHCFGQFLPVNACNKCTHFIVCALANNHTPQLSLAKIVKQTHGFNASYITSPHSVVKCSNYRIECLHNLEPQDAISIKNIA